MNAASGNPTIDGAADRGERHADRSQENLRHPFFPFAGFRALVSRRETLIWAIENCPGSLSLDPHNHGGSATGWSAAEDRDPRGSNRDGGRSVLKLREAPSQ